MNNTSSENQAKQPCFTTYFYNNLVVMQDAIMFKVLFKIVSLHQLNFNNAKKQGEPTNNIKFQYSLNEFILDLQIGRSTIIKKLNELERLELISKTKTKEDNNANSKNEYQLNINELEKIVSNINSKNRKERIIYINQIFATPTEKKNEKCGQVENEQGENSNTSISAEDEREKNIKENEKMIELQRQHNAEVMLKIQQRENEKIKPEIIPNKTIENIQIEKTTPTITGNIKMHPDKNIEVEVQSISVGNTNNYTKDRIQLKVIRIFNDGTLLQFSKKFRDDIIFSRINDYLYSTDYHTFLMDAFTETGFYNKSLEYLKKFDENDGKLLKDFLRVYKEFVEEEENNKTESAA